MSIPLSGQTWGPTPKSRPYTFYEYKVQTSDRDATSVRVKLLLRLRMQNYSSYYSFRIAHECKVNGVYQYADVKTTRRFWGHQWSGSYYGGGDFYWQQGDPYYDGRAWRGWFTVFDARVPIGVDATTLDIVPCITQPPITGLGGGGIYAPNSQDETNWVGRRGYWRPFGNDEMIGTYANRPCPDSGCFLNNYYLESLAAPAIGVYPRPSDVANLTLNPTSIDVAVQDAKRVDGKWSASQRAAQYDCQISKTPDHKDAKALAKVSATNISFLPKESYGRVEMMDGDKFWLGVQAVDGRNVTSKNRTWAGPATYFETPSEAPSQAFLMGRKKVKNEIIYRGEDAVLSYIGQKDGSYPIARFELVRVSDGWSSSWTPSEGRKSADWWQRTLFVAGVARPRQTQVFELRAYNTKGRPVYLKGQKKWLRFDVFYYGGVLYVLDERKKWHEGIAWVYDQHGHWKEADAVYVWTGSKWQTL